MAGAQALSSDNAPLADPLSIGNLGVRLPKVRQTTCSASLMSGGSHHVVQITGLPSVVGLSAAGSLPEALGCSSYLLPFSVMDWLGQNS